jgi:hypothetical protein
MNQFYDRAAAGHRALSLPTSVSSDGPPPIGRIRVIPRKRMV